MAGISRVRRAARIIATDNDDTGGAGT